MHAGILLVNACVHAGILLVNACVHAGILLVCRLAYMLVYC